MQLPPNKITFLNRPLPFIFSSIFILLLTIASRVDAQKLAVVPYATGLKFPIDLKNCGDDRLFVTENNGIIKVVNPDGTLRATPFLDISSKVFYVPEGAMLGFAFSPDFKVNRKFYVYYTSGSEGNVKSVVEEYKVSAADSNVADITSALTILIQPQVAEDHFGGNLMFGKDGFLYINFGDGGPDGGDPYGHSQDNATFMGKILRINVNNSNSVEPYTIPSSNPFYNDATPGIKKEIWASGMRNPYRGSVDRLTGDLWLPDVGEHKYEEVNFQNASSHGGENYGWNIMEGDSCFNPSSGCSLSNLALPIYTYTHTTSNAIIGGYVVRSPESKLLFGMYIFADYIQKFVDGIKEVNDKLSGNVIHLLKSSDLPTNPVSFGEDRFGSIYIVFYDDPAIYRLEDTSYLRQPKAYITSIGENGGASYLLQGLQGRNLTYQWLRNSEPIPGANLPDYDVNSDGNYTLVVTNDLGFSDTSDVFPFGALPLNFLSFTAQEVGPGKVNLEWKTSSEQNLKGYNILRKQGSEMKFSDIGFVQSKVANGNSSNELDYSLFDTSASRNSKIFYRLQIENKDGGYTYSNIISISTSKDKDIFSVYPNPAKEQFTVYINKFVQPVMMNIYDHNGQKVKEQIISQQNTTVKIAGIKGIYIVQLTNMDGSSLQRKKLLLE